MPWHISESCINVKFLDSSISSGDIVLRTPFLTDINILTFTKFFWLLSFQSPLNSGNVSIYTVSCLLLLLH